MKLGITLIILGGILLVEGGSRITIGLVTGETGLVIGGFLTGLVLGGILLYKGITRYAKTRKESK